LYKTFQLEKIAEQIKMGTKISENYPLRKMQKLILIFKGGRFEEIWKKNSSENNEQANVPCFKCKKCR
jgi:hypothetical protein